MKNTKYLQKVNCEPYRSDACPVDADDFAEFLEGIFSSEKERSFLTNRALISSNPFFTESELGDILGSLANLRASDEEGYLAELFKYSNRCLRLELLGCYNRILRYGQVDSS